MRFAFGRFRLGCLLLLVLAAAAIAQDYGDTPYVQTPQNVVDTMLKIARVRADDYVIDLGSGDGRMVITAAKQYGARGFGVDLDRRLVEISNANAAKAGVADRAVFYVRDLYETELSRATVLKISKSRAPCLRFVLFLFSPPFSFVCSALSVSSMSES